MSSSSRHHTLFQHVSIVLLLVSVGYLAYKLCEFDGYHELQGTLKGDRQWNFSWLAAVLILFPLNWLLEALKWKRVCFHLEKITLGKAYKGVLAGTATGFVSPNRLADIIGRMHYLRKENRKSAISLAAVNSLTQNIAILLPGIPLTILFFIQQKTDIHLTTYLSFLTVILFLFILVLFTLPLIAKQINNKKWLPYFSGLRNYTAVDLFKITVWSLLRFMTFSLQLFLMLRFFDVALSPVHALTGIPVFYLLVTFTPSVSFSEALIRGSWAVYILGHFADNTPGILLAGICLWFVNVIIPVVVGNVIILKKLTISAKNRLE